MPSLQVALPEPLKTRADDLVARGVCDGVERYVARLIRGDLRRRRDERIDAMIEEGLDSGPPIEVTPEFWEDIRREVEARLRGRAG